MLQSTKMFRNSVRDLHFSTARPVGEFSGSFDGMLEGLPNEVSLLILKERVMPVLTTVIQEDLRVKYQMGEIFARSRRRYMI